MYVCTCVYVCMYICIYVCMYTHTHTHTHILYYTYIVSLSPSLSPSLSLSLTLLCVFPLNCGSWFVVQTVRRLHPVALPTWMVEGTWRILPALPTTGSKETYYRVKRDLLQGMVEGTWRILPALPGGRRRWWCWWCKSVAPTAAEYLQVGEWGRRLGRGGCVVGGRRGVRGCG